MTNDTLLTTHSLKDLAKVHKQKNPNISYRDALDTIARRYEFRDYNHAQSELKKLSDGFYFVVNQYELYDRFPYFEKKTPKDSIETFSVNTTNSNTGFSFISNGWDSFDDKFILRLILRDLPAWDEIINIKEFRETLMNEVLNEFQDISILKIHTLQPKDLAEAFELSSSLLSLKVEYIIKNYQLFQLNDSNNAIHVSFEKISPLLEQFDGSYAKEFLTDCTPEKPVHRNYSWCLHCERTYIEGEHRMKHHPTNGLLSMCPYEDCDGDTVIDNRPWNEIRKFNLHYPLIPERGVEYPELSDKEEPPYR